MPHDNAAHHDGRRSKRESREDHERHFDHAAFCNIQKQQEKRQMHRQPHRMTDVLCTHAFTKHMVEYRQGQNHQRHQPSLHLGQIPEVDIHHDPQKRPYEQKQQGRRKCCKAHRLTPPSARTAASYSPFEAGGITGVRPAARGPKRCGARWAKAPRSAAY